MKNMAKFSINGFDAYKFGEQWVCLCDNQKHVFDRLSAFIAWAAHETYKALNVPKQVKPFQTMTLN